ncbi:MAG: hypothetical protein M3N13_08940, partial [Candidatus Eremiobacteraeota bacterium]|nr:hypothetical protein [Candidatus Eremiobacteraeota bacterium]
MRSRVFLFAIGLTAAIASNMRIVVAAESACSAETIAVHSIDSTKEVAVGTVTSSDGSLFVTVRDTANVPKGVGWTIDGDTLPGIHSFETARTASRPDQARITTPSFFQRPMVHIVDVNGADLCSPLGLGLMAWHSPSGTTIVVAPDANDAPKPWPAVPAGTLTLTPLISVSNAYVASTNAGIQISGALTLGGTLHSRTAVPLVINSQTSSVSVRNPITFDVPGPNGTSYGVQVANFACMTQPVVQCTYAAQLTLPNGVTSAGSTPNVVNLEFGSDGIFRLQGSPAVLSWGVNGSSLTLATLQVDAGKKSFAASGTLAVGGQSFPITGLSFEQATPNSPFYPAGTISLDQVKTLNLGPFISIKHLSGSLAFQGGTKSVATLTAGAEVSFRLKDDTSVTLDVQNLKLLSSGAPLNDIVSGDLRRWKPDFSAATIRPDAANSSLFGHALDACPSSPAIPVASPDPDSPKDMQFCIGIHLTPGKTRSADDKAYATVSFAPWDDTQKLKLRSLSFSVPPTMPAIVALAGTKVGITALRVDLGDLTSGKYGGFEQDVGPEILVTKMNCLGITGVGQATVSNLAVGGSVKQEVAITPAFGFGPGCTAFSLRGALPVQLSPQSNMLLTSLVYVHTSNAVVQKPVSVASPPPAKRDVTFVESAGSSPVSAGVVTTRE